jgi:hypothetical protein
MIGGIDYNLLYSGNASDASSAILKALYGGGASASTAVSTGNPLTDLKLAKKNQAAEVNKEAKLSQVARDISAFKRGVAAAKNIDIALSNPNVLKVLLTANNLADEINHPGLAKKVLLSDPDDKKSVVYRMGSVAWTNAVKTYNFKKNGLTELNTPKVLETLAHGYAEVMWRQSLDKATPGLSNALAFLKQAPSFTTADQILGDPIGRAVITTALGIPREIAFQNLGAQENAITRKLDIAKLQDPKFVTHLTNQYLLARQLQARAAKDGPDLITLSVRSAGLVV